jgi:chemotaxis protein MotB
MLIRILPIVFIVALIFSGCVGKEVHTQTLAELDQARSAAEQAKKRSAEELAAVKKSSAEELETVKKRSAEELEAATKRSADELEAVKQQAAADIERLQADSSRLTEELANLKKQAADETTRTETLNAQLAERDQEIAKLRQVTAEQDTLVGKLNAVNEEMTRTKQRIAELTGEVTMATQQNESVTSESRKQKENLSQAEALLEQMRQEQEKLRAQLDQEQADKAREIERLTQTQADLANSLQAEIAKGEIRIQQVADRLTINMVDRVLFDSGQGHVKPAGLKVLRQVSDILKNVKDKQIRIEGHTDNVPIRGKLKQRFPTNWELSTARATSVIRYLIDEGGINPANISAVGYADMRPIASNETDEGRSTNRRIEIVLYPKDLKQIVQSAIETSNPSTGPHSQ